MNYIKLKNNQTVSVSKIPEIAYPAFFEENTGLISGHPERHCVNYFGYRHDHKIKLICCIADDATHEIYVSSTLVNADDNLQSFTKEYYCFEKFEREIHENFGIGFVGHPWLKPVRYPFNRADKSKTIANYPFWKSLIIPCLPEPGHQLCNIYLLFRHQILREWYVPFS